MQQKRTSKSRHSDVFPVWSGCLVTSLPGILCLLPSNASSWGVILLAANDDQIPTIHHRTPCPCETVENGPDGAGADANVANDDFNATILYQFNGTAPLLPFCLSSPRSYLPWLSFIVPTTTSHIFGKFRDASCANNQFASSADAKHRVWILQASSSVSQRANVSLLLPVPESRFANKLFVSRNCLSEVTMRIARNRDEALAASRYRRGSDVCP
jgi:hypothetical protein